MIIKILNITDAKFELNEKAVPDKLTGISIAIRPMLMYRETTDAVGLQVSVEFENNQSNEVILRYGVLVTFGIDKSELFSNGEGRADVIEMPVSLRMLDLTVGVIRGALAFNIKGTKMENVILPDINIKELAEKLIVEKVETKE